MLAGLEICLSPQDRRTLAGCVAGAGWSCSPWLQLALKPLTIAFGRVGRNPSVSSSPLSSPSVSCCCSWVWECLWLASPAASAVSLLTLQRAVLKEGWPDLPGASSVRYPVFNPSTLGRCLLLLHGSFKFVTFYKKLFFFFSKQPALPSQYNISQCISACYHFCAQEFETGASP